MGMPALAETTSDAGLLTARRSVMQSSMQDFPLMVTSLFRRGRDLFGTSEMVSFAGEAGLPVVELTAMRGAR